MSSSFIKIASDFTVSWDIDSIVNNISDDIINPYENSSPYSDPSGVAHWQLFSKTNISFARNFFQNFKLQCVEVASKLRKIQKSVIDDDILTKSFVSHNIIPQRVNLIRTIGGFDVDVHCDATRSSCINIGLKNSNTFRTRISDNQDINNFYNNSTETYTMNDGDVYLISIGNAHCVESLTTVPESRYIITYNLI